MNFPELHQKLAFDYPSRISIIYPNALNGRKLSYLFGDIICQDMLEVVEENGILQVRETVDGVEKVTTIEKDQKEIKSLAHDYYFKSKAA